MWGYSILKAAGPYRRRQKQSDYHDSWCSVPVPYQQRETTSVPDPKTINQQRSCNYLNLLKKCHHSRQGFRHQNADIHGDSTSFYFFIEIGSTNTHSASVCAACWLK
jgi:hypothetical protein